MHLQLYTKSYNICTAKNYRKLTLCSLGMHGIVPAKMWGVTFAFNRT